MSHDNSARTYKHTTVRHQSYLHSPHEPMDDLSFDTAEIHETKLVEDSHIMRRKFRHIAQELRNS